MKLKLRDRRRFLRVHRVLCIQYCAQKKGRAGNLWYLSTTQNVSAGGALFLSALAFRLGDILDLQIVFSGCLEIFCGSAQVVRVSAAQGPQGGKFWVAVRYLGASKKD